MMSYKRVDGYPVRHQEYVHKTKKWLISSHLIFGLSSLFLFYGYLHDWSFPLFQFAPLAAFVFVLLTLWTPGIVDDMRVVCILPYFKKGEAKVQGDTFLSGNALARNCAYLDVLALNLELEPLSSFGFADDLAQEEVTWHDAQHGLKTVTGLLTELRQKPFLLEEATAVIEELARLEANLQSACDLQVPFCLLLRHGSAASGHEMDVRQGYFCYGSEL